MHEKLNKSLHSACAAGAICLPSVYRYISLLNDERESSLSFNLKPHWIGNEIWNWIVNVVRIWLRNWLLKAKMLCLNYFYIFKHKTKFIFFSKSFIDLIYCDVSRDVVSRVPQTSPIQLIFGPSLDKLAIYIRVQLDERAEM